MPNISPAKPGSTVVAAGTGGFQGYGAFGLGVTYRSPNGQVLVNGAVALFEFGRRGHARTGRLRVLGGAGSVATPCRSRPNPARLLYAWQSKGLVRRSGIDPYRCQ
ncbi:MAG: YadA-like family protein [Pararobbsia sp.]